MFIFILPGFWGGEPFLDNDFGEKNMDLVRLIKNYFHFDFEKVVHGFYEKFRREFPENNFTKTEIENTYLEILDWIIAKLFAIHEEFKQKFYSELPEWYDDDKNWYGMTDAERDRVCEYRENFCREYGFFDRFKEVAETIDALLDPEKDFILFFEHFAQQFLREVAFGLETRKDLAEEEDDYGEEGVMYLEEENENTEQKLDLNSLLKLQNFCFELLARNGENEKVFLREFVFQEMLAPITEIFWRVDRTADEYDERFGFSIKNFLNEFSDENHQQNLIEFGPGNGTFKKERQTEIAGYNDFAVCDKLYYPVAPLVQELLDFEKLESECGEISSQEKNLLANFLYKILVIREGQTAQDHFEYDVEVRDKITKDPQKILELLTKKSFVARRN